MRRVIIYVEGPSDRAAMEALLRPLIALKLQEGVRIGFFETPSGDRKRSLLTKAPSRAVNILSNDPVSLVAIMPDLYPKNKVFPHETFSELAKGIQEQFAAMLRAKGVDDERVGDRFHVFCFKHDLEALLLACKRELAYRLGAENLRVTWRRPVEDQDHNRPPKRVVEDLFARHGKRYKATVDAPVILGLAHYPDVTERCPQCFKPFVEFLASLDKR